MAGESKVAVVAALVANFLIAVMKLVAGLVAGSAAMLAEAAHSFSDVGNQALLLLGIRLAGRPPSARHPFGTAKSAYFWPFMVAILLFGVAGGFSIFEGIEKLFHPNPVDDVRLALGVLGVAFLIEVVSLAVAVREAMKAARAAGVGSLRQFLEENRDATLLTVLVEDGLALASLPIAAAALLAARLTGNGLWDGVGSLVIGAMLMGFAVFLALQVQSLLLGRGLSRRDREKAMGILAEDLDVAHVASVRSMYLGPGVVLLGAEVGLRDGLPPQDVTAALARVERRLIDALPHLRYVYLEPAGRVAPEPPARGAHAGAASAAAAVSPEKDGA